LQEKQSAAWLAENLKHVAGATSGCRV
jgi:hypothetical protein